MSSASRVSTKDFMYGTMLLPGMHRVFVHLLLCECIWLTSWHVLLEILQLYEFCFTCLVSLKIEDLGDGSCNQIKGLYFWYCSPGFTWYWVKYRPILCSLDFLYLITNLFSETRVTNLSFHRMVV